MILYTCCLTAIKISIGFDAMQFHHKKWKSTHFVISTLFDNIKYKTIKNIKIKTVELIRNNIKNHIETLPYELQESNNAMRLTTIKNLYHDCTRNSMSHNIPWLLHKQTTSTGRHFVGKMCSFNIFLQNMLLGVTLYHPDFGSVVFPTVLYAA